MNILTLEVKLDPESEIVLGIRIDNTDYFNIRYVVNSKEFISCSHPNIQIRIGHSSGWRKITRDLKNDLMKGIVSCKNFNRKLPEFDGLQRLTFIGSGLCFLNSLLCLLLFSSMGFIILYFLDFSSGLLQHF